MGSKVITIIAQISKFKITISQNGGLFSMLSILKTLSFSPVAEALTGLIFHRFAGENSSFSSVHILPDDGRSISRNVAEKHYDSRHDKLRKQYQYSILEAN